MSPEDIYRPRRLETGLVSAKERFSDRKPQETTIYLVMSRVTTAQYICRTGGLLQLNIEHWRLTCNVNKEGKVMSGGPHPPVHICQATATHHHKGLGGHWPGTQRGHRDVWNTAEM